MKRFDILFAAGVFLLFLPFFMSEGLYDIYTHLNHIHGFIMAFIKFAILATLGEVIGLRIKTGKYTQPGFGILPRAVVWGFLGITIKFAFIVFASGTPSFLEYMGMQHARAIFAGNLSVGRILVAFTISAAINLIYAPVMMTLHKVTDTHILTTGGTIRGLFTPIPFASILKGLNWDVQWNFVLKKTIPFFWIPAHTITFLMPSDFRVLFAALLGIVLGIILAVANMKK
ncbi:MAG: hypothetical protein DRJ09_03210 [Bacteroidetes bacterium]|nr:MAG: hypothetical protein DRJ09_03210 [Bacteroidota bacterium]